MATCENCGRELGRPWKYCIHCGAPITADAGIPGAIRPTDVAATPGPRIDLPVVIGIAVAVAGLVLIVSLAIAVLGSHG